MLPRSSTQALPEELFATKPYEFIGKTIIQSPSPMNSYIFFYRDLFSKRDVCIVLVTGWINFV